MFPQFNIHSTPLLILVLQGLVFALLLLLRYKSKRRHADLLIALILIIMAYHRTTYTIGFMGWYDTFKNTKVNYYLVPLGLAIGPMIYLYVRTIILAPFRIMKKDWIHFLPVLLFVIYKIVILIHDASQEDWHIGYGGEWKTAIDEVYINPFHSYMSYSSQLLYLAFTIQAFWKYRCTIQQNFSDTYQLQLDWIRNFLILYVSLFIYGTVTDIIDISITSLDYQHRWWHHLFSAMVIVYLGIKAYFTDLDGLYTLTYGMVETNPVIEFSPKESDPVKKAKLMAYINREKAYLDPELNLKQLARNTGMGIHEVSETINSGFGVNFNEFINGFRVEEVKVRLLDQKNDHLSILAIALDSGFKSKATFNRVFKSYTSQSPSQFRILNRDT